MHMKEREIPRVVISDSKSKKKMLSCRIVGNYHNFYDFTLQESVFILK